MFLFRFLTLYTHTFSLLFFFFVCLLGAQPGKVYVARKLI